MKRFEKITFIPNVPCIYQEMLSDRNMQFILLHKLVDNEEYFKYYEDLTARKPDDYYILDNSAFELGESMDGKLLLDWAKKLDVDEVIIPDVYEDKNETLRRMNHFLTMFEGVHKTYNLMAVPQGETLEELYECLDLMLQDERIYTIGLNKLWPRDITILQEIVNKILLKGKQIHMLGTKNLKDWGLFNSVKGIRSADSRVLAKMVTGEDDIWEEELNDIQIFVLENLLKEYNN